MAARDETNVAEAHRLMNEMHDLIRALTEPTMEPWPEGEEREYRNRQRNLGIKRVARLRELWFHEDDPLLNPRRRRSA